MLKYGQINVTDNFEITYSDINSYITNNRHSYESSYAVLSLVKIFPGTKLNPKMPTTSFNITIF